VVRAIDAAGEAARDEGQHPVPLHLRNAVTGLVKDLGHGKGYRYAHDVEGGVAPMACLPEALAGRTFFAPGGRGFEKKVQERMAENDRLREGG
jgi:putative ATPase